jgi:hypothetical protein
MEANELLECEMCVSQVIAFETREAEGPKYADSGDVGRM